MQLVTVRTGPGQTRAARLMEDGEAALLDAPDVGALLAAGLDSGSAELTGERRPAGAELGPPVLHPGKIICLGLNYASHIAEMGRKPPEYPTLFAKFAETLVGPHDQIRCSELSAEWDWEAELAVVIGRPARQLSRQAALGYVAGYTVINDVTARDWQRRTTQFLSGKTFEATAPLGPALVTPDELPEGAAGLEIRCEVDGQVMQQATTSDLVFDVADIVTYISHIVGLMPGDVIATGTPGGVGAGRDPQVFLQPGQTVRSRIDGIGELVNSCVHGPA